MGSNKDLAQPVTSLEKLQLELKASLEVLGCVEVRAVSSRHNDVRVLFAVTDNKYWELILADFLMYEKTHRTPWYSFVGKKYFPKEGDLAFGWVFIIESDELQDAVMEVRKILLSIHTKKGGAKKVLEREKSATNFIEVPFPIGAAIKEKQDRRVKPVQ